MSRPSPARSLRSKTCSSSRPRPASRIRAKRRRASRSASPRSRASR
jgi:hypothetical protein